MDAARCLIAWIAVICSESFLLALFLLSKLSSDAAMYQQRLALFSTRGYLGTWDFLSSVCFGLGSFLFEVKSIDGQSQRKGVGLKGD